MIDPVIDLIKVGPKDRILNLGIGDGAVARRLACFAREGLVLGVDPSDDAVRLARRLSVEIENVMFVPGSHEEIPWQEEFFSVVLSTTPAANWAKAAREIFRVVAAGGRVFALVPGDETGALFRDTGFDPVHTREVPLAGLLMEAGKP